MGIILVFALIILFVAAVWGREAAQKLFRGGVWVAVVFFLIFAVIVGMVMANMKGPSNQEVQKALAESQSGPYHVPLDVNAGSPTGTVVGVDPRVATSAEPNSVPPPPQAPAYQAPVYASPPPAYVNSPPAAAPVVGGRPHFGFGYAPVNGFLRVTDVYPGGPAYDEGIIPGMGILAVDGAKINSVDDLWQAQNRRHRIGDIVPFVFGDLNGSTKAVNIRLGSDAEPWGASINR